MLYPYYAALFGGFAGTFTMIIPLPFPLVHSSPKSHQLTSSHHRLDVHDGQIDSRTQDLVRQELDGR